MSSQTVRGVAVLVSFYAAREDGRICSEALHKESCVPVSEVNHEDLSSFKTHDI